MDRLMEDRQPQTDSQAERHSDSLYIHAHSQSSTLAQEVTIMRRTL